MPGVIPFIPLIAAGVAGTGAVVASKISSDTQTNATNQAVALAKEQDAEKLRQWNIQTAMAKQQWDTREANLAPYRAAHLEVLRRRGYNVPDVVPPKAPDYSGGPPPGWKPGDPIPGGASTPSKPAGGGISPWALGGAGLGLTGLGTGLAAAFNKPPDTSAAGPPSSMIKGGALDLSPAGPPSSMIQGGTVPTSSLYNWNDWSKYYGDAGGFE